MLLVVAHPAVGAGLETLLKLERYEVRRVTHLADASALAADADLALVDGVLLQGGERVRLGIPSLVLSGSAADGSALAGAFDGARGWLRKDPTVGELHSAIAGALGSGRGFHASTALALVAVSAVAAILVWGWLALRSTV